MTEPQIFILADQALNAVIAQIKPDQWDMLMPEWFQYNRNAQGELSLRQIINYHAYDDAWIPDTVTSQPYDADTDPYKGKDLLGDDPVGNFSAIVDKAVAAVKALTPEDLKQPAHLSFPGTYTVQEFLWQANSFRGFRANQIARLIGVDETLPSELVQGLWDEIVPMADEWRQMGIFQAEIPVAEDQSLQERLLGKLGLKPKAVFDKHQA